MPAAYMIVESQITDPAAFKRYMEAAPAAVKRFGGSYIVRGGRMQVLEGSWQPPRLTVVSYPDYDTALAMYNSPDYVAARQYRAGATALFNMVLVEGVDAPVA